MRLVRTNHIEMSVANMRALVADIDKREREGRTVSSYIIKGDPMHGSFVVSVVADSEHYTAEELADRKSPYLAPEAWAGVL